MAGSNEVSEGEIECDRDDPDYEEEPRKTDAESDDTESCSDDEPAPKRKVVKKGKTKAANTGAPGKIFLYTSLVYVK